MSAANRVETTNREGPDDDAEERVSLVPSTVTTEQLTTKKSNKVKYSSGEGGKSSTSLESSGDEEASLELNYQRQQDHVVTHRPQPTEAPASLLQLTTSFDVPGSFVAKRIKEHSIAGSSCSSSKRKRKKKFKVHKENFVRFFSVLSQVLKEIVL
jgi:hypothetical protein